MRCVFIQVCHTVKLISTNNDIKLTAHNISANLNKRFDENHMPLNLGSICKVMIGRYLFPNACRTNAVTKNRRTRLVKFKERNTIPCLYYGYGCSFCPKRMLPFYKQIYSSKQLCYLMVAALMDGICTYSAMRLHQLPIFCRFEINN